jgi:NADH:ubiquinone reductase (H+-translocating)
VPGFPALYAVGDIANVPSPAGGTLPQLGSVAQQAGDWAARNILAELEGGARQAVHYHELHGRLAFAAWLGGHAERKAFLSWANEFYLPPHHRSAELLDPGQVDTPQIDWRAP